MPTDQTKTAPSPLCRRGSASKSLRLPSMMGAGGLFFCFAVTGCGARTLPSLPKPALPVSGDTLASGVVHHAIALGSGTGVDLVDVDIRQAHVAIKIATEHIGRVQGMIGGQAYTPHEWLDKTHALASVNGGYFGHEDETGRKEFVGLLVQAGRVRHAAPPLTGHGGARARAGRYVRSVLGLGRDGVPRIAYAATEAGHPQSLHWYASASARGQGTPWAIQSGVGCGPMLVQNGRICVTDRQERLSSAGALPRTFVACDGGMRVPSHFIMGMASGMEYRDLAAFVVRYFARYDGTRAQSAMCLDGGASTQLSYRAGQDGAVQSPRETGVSVPDAVVVVPRP